MTNNVGDALHNHVEDLIASLSPPVEFPHKMTQAEEEMMHGHKEPMRRGGRVPIFYRHEVDNIRADMRPYADIAETWNVSYDTILKVKQAARFKDVPYIARDELDRRVNYRSGLPVQLSMRDYPVAKATKRGRPFKGGRQHPLTNEERSAISLDIRQAKIVAAQYNISVSYVAQIRREMGTVAIRRGPLTQGAIDSIKADARPYAEIAIVWKIPVQVIKHLKEERTHNATGENTRGIPGGSNAVGDDL